ncbi:hypothetical protein [Sulfuricurvum sp.]|uniref:hypothetical protein n=1 Tax=Sulfuricurvum sp. TaxID=2025608 RepID=UPI00260C2604|nr:hypothetical protein [Sulfuricurvum sp.]MDD3596534.1 hypothetical protein [Sulfuricurvum sp.]
MSILIIGEDPGSEIRKLYHRCGAYRTESWKNCECKKELPNDIDGVVLLRDECNGCLISQYKHMSGERGIPFVCIKDPKKAKSGFVKLSMSIYDRWHTNIMIL